MSNTVITMPPSRAFGTRSCPHTLCSDVSGCSQCCGVAVTRSAAHVRAEGLEIDPEVIDRIVSATNERDQRMWKASPRGAIKKRLPDDEVS